MNIEKPTVSVILPTYNRSHMVGEAIQSVLDQTLDDFELIVVDDGSTDATRQAIASHADPRIKYVYQRNAGLAGARNTGIEHARGKYLAFLDDDDLFLPDKLSLQVSFLQQNPDIGWVAGGYFLTDAHNRVLDERRPWDHYRDLGPRTWLFSCMVTPHAILLTREWTIRVGGFDSQMRYGEDWDLWLRLAHAGCPMAWVEHPVCCYRIHSTNLTHEGVKFKLGYFRMLDKFFSDPTLAPELTALQSQAYAHMHLEGAVREYRAGQIDEAIADVSRAFEIIPANERPELERTFLQLIVAWAVNPLTPDPIAYINQVFENLPASVAHLRAHYRETLAHYYLWRFFHASQRGNWSEVRRMFAKIAFHNPFSLKNRGVWSIMGSATLGPRPMQQLRTFAQALRPKAAQTRGEA